MLDIVWVSVAFLLGVLARQIGLPPLVGYLVAGFVLYGAGVEADETLIHLSSMGVTLLLFSIGLKLHLGDLLKPYIWAVAAGHMGATVVVGALVIHGLAWFLPALTGAADWASSLAIAFALSFSSTVFAVKILDEKGEGATLYARVAIGILIMQDIAAVVFIALATGKVPSFWALLLLGLLPGRKLLERLMDWAGHSELLVLFGLTLALGGAQVFDWAGVKGDLGAMLLGVLLSRHARASELSRALLSFKDLFLVCFFLSIGLEGIPRPEIFFLALLLLLFVPLKGILFFWLLTHSQLRARTAFLSGLALANYSEFALIVLSIGAAAGLVPKEWVVTSAIVLALSFILAAPLNARAHHLYERYRDRLRRFEARELLAGERAIEVGDARVLILGMGRVGAGAYDALVERGETKLVGIDVDTDTVAAHQQAGRRVLRGSATDADFWSRLRIDGDRVEMVMLALPRQEENLFALGQLRKRGFHGPVAAIAKYADSVEELRKAGTDLVFNLYAEAGSGFANHVRDRIRSLRG